MKFVKRFFVGFCLFSLCVLPCFAYSDSPPSDQSYAGAGYITCDTVEFGSIDIFIPISYKSGYLSFTDNLFNVSNSSISGIFFDGGTQYSFRISSWSTPQYRNSDSGYTWYDLTVESIEFSNIDIADEYPPLVSESDVLVYVPIVFLGVIVLCLFMKRF